MLHPDIIVKTNSISERGLFAKKLIPKGTIVYKVNNDIRIYSKLDLRKFSEKYRKTLTKFANEENNKIIHHTDDAKYGNHCCEPNSHAVPSGYKYMDVALRDIQCGEELTWDYSVLFPSWKKSFECKCGSKNCRKIIGYSKRSTKIRKKLERLATNAQKRSSKVKQPILTKKEKVEFFKLIGI